MSISCDLISDFLVDIESAGKRRPFANSSLVPRSLLSTKTFFGENFTELPSDVTSCVVAEARLYSRLIRWVINGFANLEHLPAAGILRFLNKHSTTSSSMIPLLSSNPSPAAKSLAEKIFRAALEQDNVSIVSFLLNHSKSVHANDTICYDDGQRYTPLELASRYQSYRVIELLIQWNVDVNKSFSHNSHLNALDLLLKNFDLRFQIADRLPDLVDRFLSARAKVSLSCILNQVYKLPNPDLTIRLINEFGSPQELFLDNGFLEEIAREFEKPYAERTLELVIERCQEVGANWCSYHYLLNRALERQYDELAKLLLPYIPQSDVTRILRSFKPYRSHRSHRPYSFERINIETLIVALKSKDQDNLRAVLEKDMLKNLKDCELGTPPLDIAVEQKKPEFVRGFIEHGWRNSYRITHTILEDAIRWGDNSIVRDLWQARYGEIYPHHSLMELAIEKGQIDLFWDIFEVWGIQNPNDRWPGGIVIAIERQDLRLLDEMISRGARLDDDKALETALNKHFSMARPLLERYRQAYPEGCTGYGRRSIEKAFFKVLERPDRIDLFFEFNLINGYTLQGYENGGTLLAGVLERIKRYQFGGKDCYDSSLIEKLLAAGSDVNAVSANNKTVFLLAIQTERAEIIELLIKRGAEVNKQARFGIMHTPLQKAAELNNMKIVGLLLKYGAEVNASPATFGGATALQFAAIHGNCDLAMTLVEHGARLDVPPSKGSHGRWPLEGAAENGRLDMIQLLWDTNNGPFDDKQCQKAMRLAEYYGHFGCKDLIMELMAKSSRGSW
ncbi:ankyrin repeat-containing domain protein [Xylaria flabelliformis]|nr:ankyrin repeat-containing domain protein [Xylaria flabelliformis]